MKIDRTTSKLNQRKQELGIKPDGYIFGHPVYMPKLIRDEKAIRRFKKIYGEKNGIPNS